MKQTIRNTVQSERIEGPLCAKGGRDQNHPLLNKGEQVSWTIDIRNSEKFSKLGNKYTRVEIKFK
ncbi:hypothetical protein TUM17576_12990 [Enterobacter hormaechei]|nr:hypothetical protein TUM17576_12990 [Enterobacter hormaechei]